MCHGSPPRIYPLLATVRLLGSVAENITEAGLRNSSATLIPPGTVLFSSRASIGKIAVANRECSTNQGFCNFVRGQRTASLSLGILPTIYQLRLDEITALAGKTTFKEHFVSRKKLRSFCIPVPSLKEQRRIVRQIGKCLERIDEIRRLRDGGIHESKTIEPSLLHEFLHDDGDVLRWPVVRLGDLTMSSKYGTSVRSGTIEPIGTPILTDGKYCRWLS